MSSIYKKQHKISVHEFDFNNKLKVNSLFNYIQDIAAEHAEKLQVGRKDLEKHDIFWVLSWIKVRITDYPKFGESIKIRTWPKRKHRLFSLRDLIMYKENDEEFVRASMAWLLVNSKTMRATSLETLPIPVNYHSSEDALTETPEKIPALKEKELVFKKKIKYSDIDVNQHVNNAKYVEFLLDSFSKEQFRDSEIKEITLSFLAEAKFGNEIEIYIEKEKQNNNIDVLEALNTSTNKPIFKAIIQWTN